MNHSPHSNRAQTCTGLQPHRVLIAAVTAAVLMAGRVDAATMQLASTNVATGANVSVPLTVNNTSGALGDYAVTVSFDTNVVRFGSVSGGDGQFSAAPSVVTTNVPGQVRFVHQQTVSITAPTGTVLVSRLNFTAIGASGSSSALRLSNASADSTDGQAIPVTGLTDGSVQIGGAPASPVATFSANQTAGVASLPVNFTDTSTGTITNRTWSFGDGATTNITGTSISHTYTHAGNYTVGLTVTGPGGANTHSKPNYITVTNVVTTCTISTSASPAAGGSTSGGGTKNAGTSVTVIATANTGYSFVNWTEGGTAVSASASYTFTASANRTLVANFNPIPYTISTSASPAAGGSTSGGGTKNAGTSVTVIATANTGYSFVNWTEGGTAVSASASYTFTASANRTLVANFNPIPYTISTSASPAAGGSTSGGGTKNAGTSATVIATANTGYSFVDWTEGGKSVSTSPSYTFTVSSSRTLTANYSADPETNSPVQITIEPTVTNALMRVGNKVVVADEPSVFTVGAVSSTGQPLYYTWQFGDGTNSSRSSVSTTTHAYAPECGSYTASVLVDDGTASSDASLTVAVACALEIEKLTAKLKFGQANGDSCKLTAALDLGDDFTPAGRPVTMSIGGAQVSFTLDAKGKGKNAWGACTLKFDKKTNGWKMSVKLKKGNWQTAWAEAGLVNADVAKPGASVTLTVIVLVDDEGFAADETLLYVAKAGKSGSVK